MCFVNGILTPRHTRQPRELCWRCDPTPTSHKLITLASWLAFVWILVADWGSLLHEFHLLPGGHLWSNKSSNVQSESWFDFKTDLQDGLKVDLKIDHQVDLKVDLKVAIQVKFTV